MIEADAVVSWFKEFREPQMSTQECVEYMHLLHPRVIFIKTLKKKARLLDMGAGDGTLTYFRKWPGPSRDDLSMYAFSLVKGSNFDSYEAYELGDWERSPPAFGGMSFDAIFASHFIEHVSDPLAFIRWATQRLSSDGRLYLEWPSEASKALPTRHDLIARGMEIIISNFHDDDTHRCIPDMTSIIEEIERAGMNIDQRGVTRFPFFEDEVLAHFAENNADPAAVQLAFWSKYRWAQYIVASKG